MPANGKLILVEAVVPSSSEPHFSKFIDLNMLVMTGGRERTEEEYRTLLAGRRIQFNPHHSDAITDERD